MGEVETGNLEVEEEVKEEVLEEKQEETEEEETRESVIDKIGSKIKDFFAGPQEEEGEDVPTEFTDAAQKLGWGDDVIKEFAADYDNEQLKEMIPSLAVETSEKPEDTTETQEEEEKKVEDSQDDEKDQELLDRIDRLEKALGESREKDEHQEFVELAQKANQFFDDAGKEFEIFGKTEDLPAFPDGRLVPNSPQLKARNEVWDVAQNLQAAGVGIDESMSTALDAYKGKNLASDVKRNIIKGLKKNESMLSGKHVNHESSVDEKMSGADVIREVARRHQKEII